MDDAVKKSVFLALGEVTKNIKVAY